MIVKYGKKLTLPHFIAGIQKTNPEITILIQVIEKAKLLNLSQLSAFIRDFQSQLPKKEFTFRLASNDEDILLPLTSYLEKRFGQVKVDFSSVKSETLSVQMKGQGYAYKRSLDRDLDLLLG